MKCECMQCFDCLTARDERCRKRSWCMASASHAGACVGMLGMVAKLPAAMLRDVRDIISKRGVK